jgi:hypothetical protein
VESCEIESLITLILDNFFLEQLLHQISFEQSAAEVKPKEA